MTIEDLREKRAVNINQIERNSLVDIRNIYTNDKQPIMEKVVYFFEQIDNPYCFLVGDTPVKIAFTENGYNLNDKIMDFFIRIKRG